MVMISNPTALLPMFTSFGAEEQGRYLALVSSPEYGSSLKRGGHAHRPQNKKAVRCVETGIVYESFTSAAIAMTGRASDANRVGLAVKKSQKFHKHYWRLA